MNNETKQDKSVLSDVSDCSTFNNLLTSLLSTPVKKRPLEGAGDEADHSPKRQKLDHSPSPTTTTEEKHDRVPLVGRSDSNLMNGSEPDEELFSSAKKLLDKSLSFDHGSARQASEDDTDDLFSKVNRSDSSLREQDGSNNEHHKPSHSIDLLEHDEPIQGPEARTLLKRTEANREDLKTPPAANQQVRDEDDAVTFRSAKQVAQESEEPLIAFAKPSSKKRVHEDEEPLFTSAKDLVRETNNEEPLFTSAKQLLGPGSAINENGPPRKRVKIGTKPLKSRKVNIADLFDEGDDDNLMLGQRESNGSEKDSTKGDDIGATGENILKNKNSLNKVQKILGKEAKSSRMDRIFEDDDDEPKEKGDQNARNNATDTDEDLLAKYGGFTTHSTGKKTIALHNKNGLGKTQQPISDAASKKAKLDRIFDDDEDELKEQQEHGNDKEPEEDLLEKYGGFTNFATGKTTSNILKNKSNVGKAQRLFGDDGDKKARLGRIFDDDDELNGDDAARNEEKTETDEDLLEKYGGFTNFATGKTTSNISKNKSSIGKAQKVFGDAGDKKARLGRIFDDDDDEPKGGEDAKDEQKHETDEDLLEKYGGFTNFATGKTTANILKNKDNIKKAQNVLGEDTDKKARMGRIFADDDDEEVVQGEEKKEGDEELLEKYGGFTNFATGKKTSNILKNKSSIGKAQQVLDDTDKKSRLSKIFDDDDEAGPPNASTADEDDLLTKYGGFSMKPAATKSNSSRINAIFGDTDDDIVVKPLPKRREQPANDRFQRRKPEPMNPLEKGKRPFVKPRMTVTPNKASAPASSKPVVNVPLTSSQDDQISQSDIDLLAGLEDVSQPSQAAKNSTDMAVDSPNLEESIDHVNNASSDAEISNTNANNNNVNNVNNNHDDHIDSQTAKQIEETLEGIDFDRDFDDFEKEVNKDKTDGVNEPNQSNGPSPNKKLIYSVNTNNAAQQAKSQTEKASTLYSSPAVDKKFKTPPTPQSTPGTVNRRFLTPASNSMFKQKSNFSTPSSIKRKGFESSNNGSPATSNVNKQLMFSPNKSVPTTPQRRAINYGVNETPPAGVSPARPAKLVSLFDLKKPANRYSLKDFSVKYLRRPEYLPEETLRAYNINPAIISLTSDTAVNFKFQNPEHPSESIGYTDLRMLLIKSGAVDKLASVAWVKNHYKWIVWKLASMERMFPQDYANQYLTAARVLSQLKYRYEREINQAQRPAIKKILERDEFAGRYMVLCVSAIRYRGKDGVFVPAKPVRDKGAGNPFPPLRPPSDPTHKDVSNEGANEQEADYEALGGNCAVIEVTDGWYGVNALLDEYMTAQLRRGKIFVGLKLRVFGATITGSDQAASPLEITPSTMLKLRMNGVRRAKWHAKLGLQKNRSFVVNLRSVRSLGGPIPSISVLIERVYPMLYMESYPMRENSQKVTRTEVGEWRAKKSHEERTRNILDKKFNELVQEQEDDRKSFHEHLISVYGKRKYTRQEIYEVEDREELYYLFRKEHESPEFLQLLSDQQRNELTRFIDELHATDREQVEKQLAKYREEHPDLNRTVTSFVRIQLRDHPSLTHNLQKISRGYLTIWGPHPEVFSAVREGNHVEISMPNPSESRDATALLTEGEITYMTANKMTRYNVVSRTPPPSFRPRDCTYFGNFSTLVGNKEFDAVGLIIGADQKQEMFEFNKVLVCQNIYLTDTSGVILVVQIRCNPDDFPNKELVAPGQLVGIANITYRFYDERCGIHMSSTSVYTSFYGKSNLSPYMQPTRDDIDQWTKQESGQEIVSKLKEKIDALREMNSAREINAEQMIEPPLNNNNNNNTDGNDGPKSYADDDLDEILAKMDV